MPRWLVKLADDEYVEWSTVVDAPVTYICDRDEAVREWGEQRVNRADFHVTSCWIGNLHYDSPEQVVAGNRAGEGEAEITLGEIRRRYRADAPDGVRAP